MEDRADAQLFDTLLDQATDIAKSQNHLVVEPFHMLTALVRDTGARKFLKKVGFPFKQLKKNVEGLNKEYEPFDFNPEGKNLDGTLHTDTIRHMRSSAQNVAKSFDRDYVGYMEIINSITNLGDDDSRGCLSAHNLGLEDNTVLMQFMLDESASWTPSKRKRSQTELSETFDDAANDNVNILNMDKIMEERIIGQKSAIQALHKSQKRALAGLKEANKPEGSYLFAGPTGVGKTEVAKQLAEIKNTELVRFDMSEFMEDYTVSNLIGSAMGYIGSDEGGRLTNAIQENPNCVLLLDEIEKAHPDIFNVLLQVLDDARLSDNHGNTVDFSGVTIIMTSNAGAPVGKKSNSIGFMHAETDEEADQKAAYDSAIKKLFRPEFRNRIDGVITFDHLTKENMISIAEIFIDEMNDLPAAHNNNLGFSATPEAIEALVEQSYDKEMGARPLKRFMNEYIKDMLADMILTEGLKDKEVIISYAPESDSFWIDAQPITQAKPKPVKAGPASGLDAPDTSPSYAEPVGMQ